MPPDILYVEECHLSLHAHLLAPLVSLFFGAYLSNMPIVHAATFVREGRHPLLITAMETCGALYVKTRKAIDFIDHNLAKARDELVVELVRMFPPQSPPITDTRTGKGGFHERMAAPNRSCPRGRLIPDRGPVSP